MIYELWDIISYGCGEPAIPFTLIAKADSFEEIYAKFKETIKLKPCVVTVEKIEGK